MASRRIIRGISLVEVLVSIAIIGILLAMLMPGLQTAREAARKVHCSNNLRQLAIGFHMHEQAMRIFPSDGWGWGWGPEADRGVGQSQPAGWCYHLLPYIEEPGLYREAAGSSESERRQRTAQILHSPVRSFNCPSRRTIAVRPYTLSEALVNCDAVSTGAKTDYAVNAGDYILNTPAGPLSSASADVASYPWPSLDKMTGVAFVRSEIAMRDLYDGSSQIVILGEKCINRKHYDDGISSGDDQSMFIGDDADIRRWTMFSPRRDPGNYDEIQLFGSAHETGCYMAFGDGSVRFVSYQISNETFRRLGNRLDGEVTGFPAP